MFLDLFQALQGSWEAGAGLGGQISGPFSAAQPHLSLVVRAALRVGFCLLSQGAAVSSHLLRSFQTSPIRLDPQDFDQEGNQGAGLNSSVPPPLPIAPFLEPRKGSAPDFPTM